MRLGERLEKNNKAEQEERLRRQHFEDDDMDYIKHELKLGAINQQKDIYGSAFSEGINTTKSVFDRQAVFRTTGSED